MADLGNMLSQLWGNDPIKAYATGAQIRANLDSIALQAQAQTFQQQLSFVKLQDDQAQQKVSNNLAQQEMGIHQQNANTQTMFAQHELDPNSLANQYKSAQIQHLIGGGSVGNVYNPPPVGGSVPSLPVQGQSNTPAPTLGGTPGLLPAPSAAGVPAGMDIGQQAPQGQVPATLPGGSDPDATAQSGTVVVPAAAQQQAAKDGLAMASAHQEQYGRSYEDTLGYNTTEDSSSEAPTDAEIQSAQAIQKYSDTMQQTPAAPAPPISAAQPSGPSAQISAQASMIDNSRSPVSPLAGTPPALQPTNGVVTMAQGKGYSISKGPDGTLRYQEYTWEQDRKNNPQGTWKPEGKSEEVKSAPQQAAPPSTYDGMPLKTAALDDKGHWHASYGDPKDPGKGTITTEPVLNDDGTKWGTVVKQDGKVIRTTQERQVTVKQIPDKDWQTIKTIQTRNLDDDSSKGPKATAYREAYGHDPSTPEEWRDAYALAKKDQTQDIRDLVEGLQKSGHFVPASLLKYLPAPDAPTPKTQASGTRNNSDFSTLFPGLTNGQ